MHLIICLLGQFHLVFCDIQHYLFFDDPDFRLQAEPVTLGPPAHTHTNKGEKCWSEQ
jgi:hypothetical protein